MSDFKALKCTSSLVARYDDSSDPFSPDFCFVEDWTGNLQPFGQDETGEAIDESDFSEFDDSYINEDDYSSMRTTKRGQLNVRGGARPFSIHFNRGQVNMILKSVGYPTLAKLVELNPRVPFIVQQGFAGLKECVKLGIVVQSDLTKPKISLAKFTKQEWIVEHPWEQGNLKQFILHSSGMANYDFVNRPLPEVIPGEIWKLFETSSYADLGSPYAGAVMKNVFSYLGDNKAYANRLFVIMTRMNLYKSCIWRLVQPVNLNGFEWKDASTGAKLGMIRDVYAASAYMMEVSGVLPLIYRDIYEEFQLFERALANANLGKWPFSEWWHIHATFHSTSMERNLQAWLLEAIRNVGTIIEPGLRRGVQQAAKQEEVLQEFRNSVTKQIHRLNI